MEKALESISPGLLPAPFPRPPTHVHQSSERIFPGSLLWESMVWFLQVKLRKVWGPLWDCSSSMGLYDHVNIDSVLISLSKSKIKCSWVCGSSGFCPGKPFWLWVSMCLSLYISEWLFVRQLQFSGNFRSYWSFCPTFVVVVKTGVITYKLFSHWSWSEKSKLGIKIVSVSEFFEKDSLR